MEEEYFDRSKILRRYDEICKKEILPALKKFELERFFFCKTKKEEYKKALITFIVFCFIYSIILYIINYFIPNYIFNNPQYIFGGLIVVVIVFSIFDQYKEDTKKEEEEFFEKVKEEYMETLLKPFGKIKWYSAHHIKFKEKDLKSYSKYLSEEDINLLKEYQNKKGYLEEEGITQEEIIKSKLFPIYNKYFTKSTEEQFIGTYRDERFKILETIYSNSRNNIKKRVVYILLDSNRKLTGTTTLEHKKTHSLYKKAIFLIEMYVLWSIGLGIFIFKLDVTLLDKIFINYTALMIFISAIGFYIINNNIFRLGKINISDNSKTFIGLSDNKKESIYLLTPKFIERFSKLKSIFKTEKIGCSFYEDKLMIAMETKKNLFEIGSIDKSLDNLSTLHNFALEILSIYDIIDILKFHETKKV